MPDGDRIAQSRAVEIGSGQQRTGVETYMVFDIDQNGEVTDGEITRGVAALVN